MKWRYMLICEIEICNLQNGNVLMICNIEICLLWNGNITYDLQNRNL